MLYFMFAHKDVCKNLALLPYGYTLFYFFTYASSSQLYVIDYTVLLPYASDIL